MSAALLAVSACVRLRTEPRDRQIAITAVTVIEVERGLLLYDQTVLIEGTRIVAVGPSRSVVPTRGAFELSGVGKFLIPGLWDMHVHSGSLENGRRRLPPLLARGITGVRDMGTPLEDALLLRKEVREGMLVGPRMVITGPLVNGPLPFQTPLIWSVATEAEARSAVNSLNVRGVDFIKVHDALRRAEFFALTAEARKLRIPVVGHIPPSVTADEATRAGQQSIEHLGGRFYGELLACSTREKQLREIVALIVASALRDLDAGKEPDDLGVFRLPLTQGLIESFDENRERSRIVTLLATGTWEVPTLISLPVRVAVGDTALRFTGQERQYLAQVTQLQMQLVRDMQRAGVGIMAGSDRPLQPSALAEELALLVDAGLTPLQALQTATIAPAKFLGATDSLGTIAAGRLADLVLLNANPLENITAVSNVRAVIANGRLLNGDNLRRLQSSAATSLNRNQVSVEPVAMQR